MLYHSRYLQITLFSLSCAVILVLGFRWAIATSLRSSQNNSFAQTMMILFALGTLFFVLLSLFRALLVAAFQWAARKGHLKFASFLHRIAPQLTRAVAGTAVGTSFILSSATLAASATNDTVYSLQSGNAQTSGQSSAANTEQSSQLPTPRWSAEPINVEMPRILGAPKKARTPSALGEEIVVRAGDTLWSIAREQLGEQANLAEISAYWPRIYQANKAVIGDDPDLLELGLVLVLPNVNP